MNISKNKLEQFCREFKDNLPHGSGINGNWSFEIKQSSVVFRNFYESINDGGMYCHTVDFRMVIPVENINKSTVNVRFDQFKLHGNFSQSSCSCLFGLKDYLDETLSYGLEDAEKYTYVVDCDERGGFSAHLEDCNGNEVFAQSLDSDDSGLWMVTSGYMKNGYDTEGLLAYLVQQDILSSNATITLKG